MPSGGVPSAVKPAVTSGFEGCGGRTPPLYDCAPDSGTQIFGSPGFAMPTTRLGVPTLPTPPERFDPAYYARFYDDPRTRVHDATQIAALGRAISGFAEWFGLPLKSALEVGAGTGLLRDWFRQSHPATQYVSTEVSRFAADKYGHELLDIAKTTPKKPYDLVICQGVLPYLDDAAAEAALENLARATRGLLYLEAITHLDLHTVCDRSLTDVDVHDRKGSWYRDRLGRHFEQVGAGLWHKQDGPLLFYELERAPRRKVSPAS